MSVLWFSYYGQITTQQMLYEFSSFTFTNAGATGKTGPTLTQLQSSYSSASWASNLNNLSLYNSKQGYQLWTVPSSGMYNILCAGAKGSLSANGFIGGKGGIISATFYLEINDELIILVGQVGQPGSSGGGGGGSFVIKSNGDLQYPLLVAGGGGGGNNNSDTYAGLSPSIVQTGAAISSPGAGGAQGYQAAAGYSADANSGGTYPARSVLYAGTQTGIGAANNLNYAFGGFGCAGAGGQSSASGGGGGGYSGGRAGGGSLAAGAGTMYSANLANEFDVNIKNDFDNGYVTISKL
jgi:hypothetical protein